MTKRGMFSVREVGEAANALGDLLVSKPDIEFATSRLAKIQPERADFWQRVSVSVRNGYSLSEQLAGHWTEDFVQPIRIGEKSSALPKIFHKIRDASAYSEKLAKILFKLVKPAVYAVAALIIIAVYVGFVLPELSSMMDQNAKSVVGGAGGMVHDFLIKAWPVCVAVIVGLGVFAYTWVRTPDNRLRAVGWAIHVPYIGKGLGRILFAKWARYMSIMNATGMDLWDMLRLTAPVLPVELRSPLLIAATLLEQGAPMSRVFSEDSEIYREVNRDFVPHEIVNAFLIAADTGNLHQQLDFAEINLDRDGKEQLEKGIGFIDNAITVLVFVAMSVPMFLYFSQMFENLAAGGRGL